MVLLLVVEVTWQAVLHPSHPNRCWVCLPFGGCYLPHGVWHLPCNLQMSQWGLWCPDTSDKKQAYFWQVKSLSLSCECFTDPNDSLSIHTSELWLLYDAEDVRRNAGWKWGRHFWLVQHFENFTVVLYFRLWCHGHTHTLDVFNVAFNLNCSLPKAA